MSTARLRVVSDLHYGETAGRVQRLSVLEPLFEGADRVVFNGDSLETRFLDLDPAARERKAVFDVFCRAHRDHLTLLTGNHDPDISAIHHLDLEDGRVLVTHGDTLFLEIVPWSWEAPLFRAEQKRRLAVVPAENRHEWETRLRICKETIHALREHATQMPRHRARRLLRSLRFLLSSRLGSRVFRAWREAPEAATRLAETYRPAARIVIVGHVHRPGWWRIRDRIVVNTGSCMPPFGGQVVDLIDRRIELRPLAFRHGAMTVEAITATIDLDAAFAPTESARSMMPDATS